MNYKQRMEKNFPVLKRKINGNKIIYLDNAATSLTPQIVIKEINKYYNKYNANIHRGIHTLSEEATILFEETRKKIADFINAEEEEIIFTSGTTDSLNMLSLMFNKIIPKEKSIVLSKMEHHSNIIPWQQLSRDVKFINIKNFELDLNDASKKINKNTGVVSIIHASNVLGTINPIEKIIKLAHEVNSYCIVDAAQTAPHLTIDVKKINCDALVFSSHKMCGPTGVGVLYLKKELHNKIQPVRFGGNMMSEVDLKQSTWNESPAKYEAGTPNIANVIGFKKSIEYLNEIKKIKKNLSEKNINEYAIKRLKEIAEVYTNKNKNKIGVISFNVKGIHPHDLATLLDREGIAIRSGHHCAMPLMKELKIQGTARISLYFYNTKEEIDLLIKAIKKAKRIING